MVVQAENLRCTRGGEVDGFTIEVPRLCLERGEIVAVTGPSGSGKSTLLEVLGLVLRPEDGSVFKWMVKPGETPVDVGALWRAHADVALGKLRARLLGFVLQTGGLLPFLNVRRNIMLPRQLAGMEDWSAATDELVGVLGIAGLLARKPHQLSIGERQRAAIARALAHDPLVLLTDEPTSALDPDRSEKVIRLLVDLVRGRNRVAVIVTHDHELIRSLQLRQLEARLEGAGGCARFVEAA